MTNVFKKLFIIPLLVCIVTSFVVVNTKSNVLAAEEPVLGKPVAEKVNLEKLMDSMFGASFEKLDMPSPNDKVWVVVEMNDFSLLDYAKENQYKGEINEYLETEAGQAGLKEIVTKQEALKERISAKLGNVEYKYSYNTVTNGFAAKIKFKDYQALTEIAGVKDVMFSFNYDVPCEGEAEEVVTDISTLKGAKSSSETYRGQGMVIGIVDTGLYTTHEAFQVEPELQPFTREFVDGKLDKTVAGLLNTLTTGSRLGVEDVYVNGKVPFAYDYADMDTDVNPDLATMEESGNDHGTHVAGIAAGNNGKGFTGSASEAQLAIFKVFSDEGGGANSVDMMAALNDAIILGVDTINMSLGSTSGFDVDSNGEEYQAVYESLYKAGINLVCAAGNEYMAGVGTEYTFGTPSTLDQSTISSPSSYTNSFSVASFATENEKERAIILGGNAAIFNECALSETTGEKANFIQDLVGPEGSPSKSFEYVYCGLGSAGECRNAGVAGKVALISRGELTFKEKADNAAAQGAIAVIIFNNVAGSRFNPVVEGMKVPTCSISLEEGMKAVKAENKVLEVGWDTYIYGGVMSDFSSWGPGVNLTIKPEITTYGGSVYSSLPKEGANDYYGLMSGTSMASPNMAGNVTLVKQHVRDIVRREYTKSELADLAYKLIMSTATPVVNRDNGAYYTPRRQGAGLINIDGALNTPAYISVGGQTKTKIELGDDPEKAGVYTLNFNVNNMGQAPLKYEVKPSVFTTEIHNTNPMIVMGSSYVLNPNYNIKCFGCGSVEGNVITVEPGKSCQVSVKVVLSDADREYIDFNFKYGSYVEGFVVLDALEGTDINLSTPFLGFYGDWDKLPVFDSTIFDDEKPLAFDGLLVTSLGEDMLLPMGDYLYKHADDVEVPKPSMDHISVSPINDNGIHNLYAVFLAVFRNIKTLEFEFYDAASDELLFTYYGDYIRKSSINPNTGAYQPITPMIDEAFDLPNNSVVKMVIRAEAFTENPWEAENSTLEFLINIDAESPEIIGLEPTAEDVKNDAELANPFNVHEEEGRTYLEFDVRDNFALQSLQLMDMEQNHLCDPIPFFTPNGEIEHVKVDITDYLPLLTTNEMLVYVDDYALNYAMYRVPTGLAPLESIKFDQPEYTCPLNDVAVFDLVLTPEDGFINLDTVELTVEDESIVFVSLDYMAMLGLAEGETTMTIKVETVDGKVLTDTAKIKVVQPAPEPVENELALDHTKETLKVGDSLELKPSFKVAVEEEQTFTWTSSDEEVATVENGKVTAKGSGLAVITCEASNGLKAECSLVVLEEKDGFVLCGSLLVAYTGEGGDVVVPEGVTEIAAKVFAGNEAVTTVVLPETLTTIGDAAFSEMPALTKVEVKSTAELAIGTDAFLMSELLAEVVLPEEVSLVVGDNAFAGTGFVNLDLANVNVEFGECVFAFCASLETVAWPESMIVVPNGTFMSCESLTSVTYSGALLGIGEMAFNDCVALESATLPADLVLIGDAAFAGCSSLKELVVETVKPFMVNSDKTEAFAFADCPLLKSVKASEASAYESSEDGALYVKGFAALVCLFENVTLDDEGAFVLPEGIELIAPFAFLGAPEMVSVKLPSTLATIDSFAFSLAQLQSLVVPSTVDSVDEGAFAFSFIDEVVFEPNYGIEFAENVFNTSMVVSVVLPEGLVEIPKQTFIACEALESVVIPSTVTYIGEAAFAEAGIAGELVLPENVLEIDNGAFAYMPNLETLVLPRNLVVIDNAWQTADVLTICEGCASLKEIKISGQNNNFMTKDGALYSKNGKVLYAYPAGTGETEVVIPAGVVHIMQRAFVGMETLTKVTLPASLEAVGDCAFLGCPLTEVVSLNPVAPKLEEFLGIAKYGAVHYTVYANFREPIAKVVMGQIFYSPLEGLKLVVPENSKGYDAFGYNMMFDEKETFTAEEALADSDLVVEATEDQAKLSWKGAGLGAIYEVYRVVEGAGEEFIGSTSETSFTDCAASGIVLKYTYHVVATYKDSVKEYRGEALEVSFAREAKEGQEKIVELINEIKEVSLHPTYKDQLAISSCLSKYNALTAPEQKLVANGLVLLRINDNLQAGKKFNDKILSTVKSTVYEEAYMQVSKLQGEYSRLPEEIKPFISGKSILNTWEKDLSVAKKFNKKIYKFKDVDITSGPAIQELKDEYAKMSNYAKSVVEKAYMEKIAELDSKYAACLEEAARRNVNLVIDLISKLPEVPTSVDSANIETAREAYEKLSEAEKKLIPEELLAKLESCETSEPKTGCTVSLGAVVVSTLSAFALLGVVLKRRDF